MKDANFPIDNVSWLECDEFIQNLNNLTKLSFRLPTEAEWEFAARGGIYGLGYLYSRSNNVDEVGWTKSNSDDSLHEVKSKKLTDLIFTIWLEM